MERANVSQENVVKHCIFELHDELIALISGEGLSTDSVLAGSGQAVNEPGNHRLRPC